MGRPKQYTDEERKELARLKAKKQYYQKIGYGKGECPAKPQKHKHPCYTMFANSKMRAKKKGLPFDLVLEDIEMPTTCPILGIEIKRGTIDYTDNSPTLDRIIPSLGYIKTNVWVISMRANRLKQDASIEELELLVTALKNKLLDK